MKWPLWSWALLGAAALAGTPLLAGPASYEARIISGESASVVMRGWCADHGRGPLTARRVAGADKAPGPNVRAALHSRDGEAIGYRRVILGCDGVVLSRADNWYLPGLLTPRMNHQLTTTQTPFGLAVHALAFTRRTLDARHGPGPADRLRVRAVLVTRTGTPFSYVVEDYGSALNAVPGR